VVDENVLWNALIDLILPRHPKPGSKVDPPAYLLNT
jgi:hypothetical protein